MIEKRTLSETRRGFYCCMSIPKDCNGCPFKQYPELQGKHVLFIESCTNDLAVNIGHWLNQVKDDDKDG